jgi:Type I phosphodiesterase / nucleotide pyrophosphatase
MTGEGSPAVMPDVPASLPVLPRYGESTLADLGASVLWSLGAGGEPGPVALPAADRVCLLVVDGLGWELLREHPAAAPFLSELGVAGRVLMAGFPATTATSLASLGTGRPPGQHGVLGYQVAVPGEGRLLNALHWDARVDPVAWQPGPTIFERAVAAGIAAFRVGHASLRKTGLSTAALRGAQYGRADTFGGLVGQAEAVLRARDRALVMVYHDGLDATGHVFGPSSDAWRYHLGHVDILAEQLAGVLPAGTVFHVTADHGMVDVPEADRVDVDAVAELRAGVALLGGEPRARHVYAVPGAAGDVLAAWREVLGHRAWVASREEAVADGWFGPVDGWLLPRIGDVVAAPAGPWAIVATQAEPREFPLIGMHGSLTSGDQLVPLLTLLPV